MPNFLLMGKSLPSQRKYRSSGQTLRLILWTSFRFMSSRCHIRLSWRFISTKKLLIALMLKFLANTFNLWPVHQGWSKSMNLKIKCRSKLMKSTKSTQLLQTRHLRILILLEKRISSKNLYSKSKQSTEQFSSRLSGTERALKCLPQLPKPSSKWASSKKIGINSTKKQ